MINAYAANYESQSFRGTLMLNFIRDNTVPSENYNKYNFAR